MALQSRVYDAMIYCKMQPHMRDGIFSKCHLHDSVMALLRKPPIGILLTPRMIVRVVFAGCFPLRKSSVSSDWKD